MKECHFVKIYKFWCRIKVFFDPKNIPSLQSPRKSREGLLSYENLNWLFHSQKFIQYVLKRYLVIYNSLVGTYTMCFVQCTAPQFWMTQLWTGHVNALNSDQNNDSVARSWQAFTATFAKNHGNFLSFPGHLSKNLLLHDISKHNNNKKQRKHNVWGGI